MVATVALWQGQPTVADAEWIRSERVRGIGIPPDDVGSSESESLASPAAQRLVTVAETVTRKISTLCGRSQT